MIPQAILTRVEELHVRLVGCDFGNRLARFSVKAPAPLSAAETRFLLAATSRLSLGGDFIAEEDTSKWKDIASDIVARLAYLNPNKPSIVAAADMLLARLGNFPSQKLLRDGFPGLNEATPASTLSLEAASRELENTILIREGKSVTFTDFQFELFGLLGESNAVSVSAPTSAGKSYVLSLDVVRKLSTTPGLSIVYVVPTRALIRQVTRDLRERLVEYGLTSVVVTSAPNPVPIESGRDGVVYVLTQERLMTFLYPVEGVPIVNVLYVDEAQELSAKDRGMILHSAVTATKRKFPSAQIVFSSPLTRNPEFLLQEFALTEKGLPKREFRSPVGQTLIFLDSVKSKPKAVDLKLLTAHGLSTLASASLNFEFRGTRSRLAHTAYHFTEPNESSIIYANRPSDAESIAETIASLISDPSSVSSEISELMDFIRGHISKDYLLLDLLPKGVAYHYGQMPSLVRTRVEELVRSGSIRFVCCTSTLLQGVNLPAKNIFIQAPKKGLKHPMQVSEFWNLAGRAGRLRYTFSGNVWCLDAEDWDSNPLDGDRYGSITSAFRETLTNDAEAVTKMAQEKQVVSTGTATEQAFAKVFSEYTLGDFRIAETTYATDKNREELGKLDAQCTAARAEIQVSREILEKNASISPWCLQRVYQILKTHKPITANIPAQPYSGGASAVQGLFQIIDLCFLGKDNRSHEYLGALAYRWMIGDPLAAIISNRIQFYNIQGKTAINNDIRELLDTLENTLHFQYVKYTRAYIDVLRQVIMEEKRDDLLEKIPPIHIYLEFGACEQVLLNLMALGLSRITAILLRRTVGKKWVEVTSPEDLRHKLTAVDLNANGIPLVCQRELAEFIAQPKQLTQQGGVESV